MKIIILIIGIFFGILILRIIFSLTEREGPLNFSSILDKKLKEELEKDLKDRHEDPSGW